MRSSTRDRLIVGLDLPDSKTAQDMVARLGDSVGFYKIGMELIYGGGLDLVKWLAGNGKRVFVDLKLHDIPNTVEKAAAQIARLGADFLTIHAYPQTMRAAQAGVAGSGLKLLAVTIMTSFDEADVRAAGYSHGMADMVTLRARQARESGIAGLILPACEVQAMRALLGPETILVSPGIRPAGSQIGDQKRVMTPALAIAAGADYLVVARPILAALDPKAAAEAIIADIAVGEAMRNITNGNAARTCDPLAGTQAGSVSRT